MGGIIDLANEHNGLQASSLAAHVSFHEKTNTKFVITKHLLILDIVDNDKFISLLLSNLQINPASDFLFLAHLNTTSLHHYLYIK